MFRLWSAFLIDFLYFKYKQEYLHKNQSQLVPSPEVTAVAILLWAFCCYGILLSCMSVDPLSAHPSTRRENHSELVIFWRILCCILVLYIRLLSLPSLRKDTCSPPLFFYQQSLVEILNKDEMTSISVENLWSWSVHQFKGETNESQLPLSTNRPRLSSTLYFDNHFFLGGGGGV